MSKNYVTFISVTMQASLQIYTIYTTRFNQFIITIKVHLLFIPIILTLFTVYIHRNTDTFKSTYERVLISP